MNSLRISAINRMVDIAYRFPTFFARHIAVFGLETHNIEHSLPPKASNWRCGRSSSPLDVPSGADGRLVLQTSAAHRDAAVLPQVSRHSPIRFEPPDNRDFFP
jgi:hypothetical protein